MGRIACSVCWWMLLPSFLSTVDAVRILPSARVANKETKHDHRVLSEPVLVEVPKSPDGHLVTSLPLLDPSSFTTQHWSGHLPASGDGTKFFFYWLFAPDLSQSTTKESDVPLIIWLNGGPACSSMDGLFIENGPFRLTLDAAGKYQVTPDPNSWHSTPAYTLYVDQPVGTGLSFTTGNNYPRNDEEVNVDFYFFLQEFFTLHSDKFVTGSMMNRDLFFSGESYAGHYIPSLMNYLLHKKQDAKGDTIEISVRGGAIGNGWTDPFYQYAGADFAYGHGLIDMKQVAAFKEREQECQGELNMGHYNVGVCFALIDDIIHESHGGTSDWKASGYDVRKSESKHASRKFPPGHKVVETYLGGWDLPQDDGGKLSTSVYKDVLVAIHATAATAANQRYQECTDPPYNALAGNDGKGVVDDVVQILEHPDKVKLLFFNGIHDIICNHVGNEKFLEMLPWSKAEKWVLADRYAWVAQGEEPSIVSGYMKEYENLMFLKIMDAGHMVPLDVPNVAADMIKIFTSVGSFSSSLQALEKGDEDADASCPVCPMCHESREPQATSLPSETTEGDDYDEIGSKEGKGGDDTDMATFVISYAWLVAGLGCVAFLCVLAVVRRRSGGSAFQRDIVPQSDLELRDVITYHDEPPRKYGNGQGDDYPSRLA